MCVLMLYVTHCRKLESVQAWSMAQAFAWLFIAVHTWIRVHYNKWHIKYVNQSLPWIYSSSIVPYDVPSHHFMITIRTVFIFKVQLLF
jgi:hypothetical protein